MWISCYLDPVHEVMKLIRILPSEKDPSGSGCGSTTLVIYLHTSGCLSFLSGRTVSLSLLAILSLLGKPIKIKLCANHLIMRELGKNMKNDWILFSFCSILIGIVQYFFPSPPLLTMLWLLKIISNSVQCLESKLIVKHTSRSLYL